MFWIFDILGPLQFHMNFRMSLSISAEKGSWVSWFSFLLGEVFAWSGWQNDHLIGLATPPLIWTSEVKFARIWNFVCYCSILGKKTESRGCWRKHESEANLHLNHLSLRHHVMNHWPSLCSSLQSIMRTGVLPATPLCCGDRDHGLQQALQGPPLAPSYKTHWPGRQL